MKEFLAVGEIINTHGIKGEVKVYPLTDDMKDLKIKRSIYRWRGKKNIIL